MDKRRAKRIFIIRNMKIKKKLTNKIYKIKDSNKSMSKIQKIE
jgi:hypothetical protein